MIAPSLCGASEDEAAIRAEQADELQKAFEANNPNSLTLTKEEEALMNEIGELEGY